MLQVLRNSYKYDAKRYIFTSSALNGRLKVTPGNTAAGTAHRSVINEPEPVRDTQLLMKKCCGANKLKDQEDPDIKADSDYPDWLWSIHVGKPRLFYEYDPSTKEYWHELEKHKEAQKDIPRKEVTFYREPREYELRFISRIANHEPAKEDFYHGLEKKCELQFDDRLPLKGPVIGDS